ncbi:MAG: peptidoglycan recognition protein family protein, partial [Actinomycetia bacterium]|nr:peptidoglycan recognition protein family protein [Actinomycetes bacterium]
LGTLLLSACTVTNSTVGTESASTSVASTTVLAAPPTTVVATTTTAVASTTTAVEAIPPSSTTSTTTLPEREAVTIEVRSRGSWGASEPDADLTAHSIDRITVHHTARPHDDTPMEEKLQRWQNYHQSIGFGDIAYHMVIGADGTIYQGRDFDYVGATRTSYDPAGHFLPSLDGMFDELWDSPNDDDDEPDGADELSAAQLGSLLDLLAWASVEFGIPPAEIAGHRDYAATACPGTVVHEMLQSGEIAERVAERIDTSDFDLVYVDA